MRVKLEQTASIKPHPANPRRDHDVDGIARSIQAFGFRQPLVVWDGDGYLVVGHGRLLAALQLGLEKVPVHHVAKDEMTEREAMGYRLADNRSAEGSIWDEQMLLLALDEMDERERELAGFDQVYLEQLRLRASVLDGEVDPFHEWQGMPEFVQEDKEAHKTIVVHFKDQAAVDDFANLVGATITKSTRFLWFPQIEIERYADKRYAAAVP